MLMLFGVAVVFILAIIFFAHEFSVWLVYGNPFKNYKENKDIIEKEWETKWETKYDPTYDVISTNTGYFSSLEIPSATGIYYFCFTRCEGKNNYCIRIPYTSPLHKQIKQYLNVK